MTTFEGFAEDGDAAIAFDATGPVADDFAKRDDRDDLSQFLLRFETITDQDGDHDRAVFSPDALELQLTYVAP